MTSIEKISFQEYEKRDGVNNSGLNKFRRSPRHYQAYKNHDEEKTDAMGFGSVMHKLVFESEEWLSKLTIGPTKGRDTDKFKTAEAKRPDLLFVTEEESKKVLGMVESIRSHKKLMGLLKGGHAEQSLFADHPATGLQLKGRLDFICNDGRTILDLKTCQDARIPAFEREVAKRGYHYQAAYYRMLSKLCGLTHSAFTFIAIEKNFPFGIMLHQLEVVSIGYATDKNEEALEQFKRCQEKDSWPSYEEEIQTITLPMYAMELDEELL